jgi:AcrR family transcriptional regulator
MSPAKELSTQSPKPRAISPANGREMLERNDWRGAARSLLARAGVNAVKIDRLARELGVTRSGFHYGFKNRGETLNALVQDRRAHIILRC